MRNNNGVWRGEQGERPPRRGKSCYRKMMFIPERTIFGLKAGWKLKFQSKSEAKLLNFSQFFQKFLQIFLNFFLKFLQIILISHFIESFIKFLKTFNSFHKCIEENAEKMQNQPKMCEIWNNFRLFLAQISLKFWVVNSNFH